VKRWPAILEKGRERLIDAGADPLPEEDEWRECLVWCASLPVEQRLCTVSNGQASSVELV
jgi:hypothetical protein